MNKFPELVPKICPNEYLLIDVIAVSASHSIYNKISHIFSCYFIVLFRLPEDKLCQLVRSDQLLSRVRLLTLCDPMNPSTPGLPVHHQLPEFTQTHVLQVSDAIQPSHPLPSPSPPAPNPSQHQSLFQ